MEKQNEEDSELIFKDDDPDDRHMEIITSFKSRKNE